MKAIKLGEGFTECILHGIFAILDESDGIVS